MIYLNKKTLRFIAILGVLIFITAGCNQVQKDVVAKVNGENIPKEEFDRVFNEQKEACEAQFGPDIMSKIAEDDKTFEEIIKENTLEMLITQKIVLAEANKKNIVKEDQDIKNLIYQKYAQNYIEELNISDEEAKKYFEDNKDSLIKVRASHILVESEEEGKKILEKLKKGEDFHSLATTESIDTNSAAQGGDLNYFQKGAMVKEFDEVAFSLKPGEISDLVKTDFGYHIIKVEDRMDTYDDLKDNVIEELKFEKFRAHINEMREKADVKIYLEENEKNKKNSEENKSNKKEKENKEDK